MNDKPLENSKSPEVAGQRLEAGGRRPENSDIVVPPASSLQPKKPVVNCSTVPNRLLAVVFDMDGLMFNTEDVYGEVGSMVLRRRGHEFTPELKSKMMGLRPQPAFEVMIDHCSLAETWRDIAAESNRLFIEILGDRLKPMPGLMELLDALERAEVPKAIGTSSCRELVTACLEPFDLERRFQFVLTAEDVKNGKPDPEIYLTAARRLAVSPTKMMVLEDSENGCRAAAAAEAFVVAVPGEHSQGHDFDTATLVVDSLADPRILRALGANVG